MPIRYFSSVKYRFDDISVRMSGLGHGLGSRSLTATVDMFGVGPEGCFVGFYCHSADHNGGAFTSLASGFAIS